MAKSSPARRTARYALLGLLLGSTALTGLAVHAQNAPASVAPAITLERAAPAAGFADLVKAVRPAVVTINVSGKQPRTEMGMPNPGQGEGRMQGTGSGFIIDAAGFIVTNNHVVDGASRITVKLEDGRELQARLVGRDARTDVALLKIEAGAPLPFVALGDSDRAQPGDWVVAMGNPYGLSGTVTTGVVSATGRDIGAGPYDDFIQVDAPINQGNSGGPLFSRDGGVIGVNTAIFSPTGGSVGIGFAVPSNMVKRVVAELREKGFVERGFLGVSTQPVNPAMAAALKLPANGSETPRGALVAGVERDSPAAKAGLQPGDVVTALDSKPVRNPRDLARSVADLRPGTKADLKLWRDGAERSLRVDIAAQPGTERRRAGAEEPNAPRIGVALVPVTPEARASLRLPNDAKGALVQAVEPNSRAQEAGLRRGDVIIGVGATTTDDAEAVMRALREANAAGGAVAVRILRDGKPAFIAVPAAQA
ncbi:MAG: Do family serine endopeptidase [Alphaproteobacteria bacterium]